MESDATRGNKDEEQSRMFANRLSKNYKQLKKWARNNRITAFRLYDKDIPEVPLAVDLYTFLPAHVDDKLGAILSLNEENTAISSNSPAAASVIAQQRGRTWACVYLYERPYEKDSSEEERWLSLMAKQAAKALEIDESHVITKTRRHQSDGDGERRQYEKENAKTAVKGLVEEQGQVFSVNLTDYIDTGLFFDHRVLRDRVRAQSQGKRVLNLFCYTGSFSVYAAEGRAKSVESVDMSNTYLEWAKENMRANGFIDPQRYAFQRMDVGAFLDEQQSQKEYDIIVLDPPTFSNSKKTATALDINRDWPSLVQKCLALLAPGGTLYFSTNSRRLSFKEELLPHDQNGGAMYKTKDITAATIPQDYRNAHIHRAWEITAIEGKSGWKPAGGRKPAETY